MQKSARGYQYSDGDELSPEMAQFDKNEILLI